MRIRIRNAHNYVPERFAPKVVAIVGGKGSMGQRLAEEFLKDGYEVRLTGEEPLKEFGPTRPEDWKRAVRRWNEKICRDADVVVFAVPIPTLSREGLTRIFGRTPPRGWRNKLVIDICSTKSAPLRALSELRGATVIGTHPMFGPSLKSLTGQTVFVCPLNPSAPNPILRARLDGCLRWLQSFWERRCVHTFIVTPEEHDAFMPLVQFGVLLSVLLYGDGLMRAGASLAQVQRSGTPNSLVLCTRLARMTSRNMLQTYLNLIFDNLAPNQDWLEGAIASLTQLQKWMATDDREAALKWMENLATFQSSSFQAHFTEMSQFLDACIANKDLVRACLAENKAANTQRTKAA